MTPCLRCGGFVIPETWTDGMLRVDYAACVNCGGRLELACHTVRVLRPELPAVRGRGKREDDADFPEL